MSSPNLSTTGYQSFTRFSPQFCEACLRFDDELSRIESLLEREEPPYKSTSVEGPTQQLKNLPSLEISKTRHIWDYAAACRCCLSLLPESSKLCVKEISLYHCR
jgi:hypothetical protein